jgi:hypothetical protein
LFIVVQHITLTVIMKGEIFLGQKDVALADTMWVARLMALGARRSTRFQSPSIMN